MVSLVQTVGVNLKQRGSNIGWITQSKLLDPKEPWSELTTKREQSSVSVSYSPPSPHTLIPYILRSDGRMNKPLTQLSLKI